MIGATNHDHREDLNLDFQDSCSEVQIRLTLNRLASVIEGLSTEVEALAFVAVDSEPLPVCTFKRAPRCKFRGTKHSFSTAGSTYGFKLHAWSTLNGTIARYEIRPANEHDFVVGCAMNRDWAAYGAPKQTEDKGYQSGTYLTPGSLTLAGRTNTLLPARSSSQPAQSWWVWRCARGKSRPWPVCGSRSPC
ncbi:hypothetical protein Deipe_1891 [Deinococcus peraridilitoris DSM 19664]|uniref:Transposase DDE domain-containing protein n=1 Tax=Deinococcus peraridilitoris (strain DSM 19664 / LMG 22246 / CIP 109416 / KR-200) TaxID=937777 RepID=L0A2I0_DEIPD|nr:hypothetical protein Deipe_1891 [Deinococcus peraridilitoris DSM 19664]